MFGFSRSKQKNKAPVAHEWHWTPRLWQSDCSDHLGGPIASNTPLCDGISIFHDGAAEHLIVSQSKDEDVFVVDIDTLQSGLGYYSLVAQIPDGVAHSLTREHIIEFSADITGHGGAVYIRLNLGYGPNVEQVNILSYTKDNRDCAEFDLWYTKLNKNQMERAWLDIIFDKPEQGGVRISNLSLTRRRRAQF